MAYTLRADVGWGGKWGVGDVSSHHSTISHLKFPNA